MLIDNLRLFLNRSYQDEFVIRRFYRRVFFFGEFLGLNIQFAW